MKPVSEIRTRLGETWLPQIYEDRIRTQRTRSMALDVPARENRPEILHTLLGIELKIGKIRIACPDLAMARYLCVFASLGCQEVAVPYDITQLSGIADELETAWQRMLLVFEDSLASDSAQSAGRKRAALIRAVRDEIDRIGAGDRMPLFNRSTKQR